MAGTNMNDIKLEARRHFLRFLAGSPLLASLRTEPGFCAELGLDAAESLNLISSAKDAIDVFDFESVAGHELPPAHWGYLKTGVDDDGSLLANRRAFSKYYMRPRRLVGVSKIDMSVNLFGRKWETPIALSPAGSQGAFHDDGEIGVAAAAKKKRHLMMLSTYSSNSVGDVAEAYGGPIWFQLYASSNFEVTRGLVQKAEAASATYCRSSSRRRASRSESSPSVQARQFGWRAAVTPTFCWCIIVRRRRRSSRKGLEANAAMSCTMTSSSSGRTTIRPAYAV